VGKQLKEQLMSKEKARVKKTIDAKVKVALKAEAKRLAEKAVAKKTKDTLQAMEKGHAHVKSQKKQVKAPSLKPMKSKKKKPTMKAPVPHTLILHHISQKPKFPLEKYQKF